MPAPLLAAWVVPGVLTLLAVAISAVLVLRTHQRRLAEIPDLDEVEIEPVSTSLATDARVLQRQVEVLTQTLAQWDNERRQAAPEPVHSPPAPATVQAPAPETDTAQAPVMLGPATSFAALSRELAAAGDTAGAVLAQWTADLQVLRPALGEHGPELARAVAAVRTEHPVRALRTCREAALGLVRQAGSVRALLAPLDHLADLRPGTVPEALTPTLVDLLEPDQRARLVERGLTA